jgi:hypothetical protein
VEQTACASDKQNDRLKTKEIESCQHDCPKYENRVQEQQNAQSGAVHAETSGSDGELGAGS